MLESESLYRTPCNARSKKHKLMNILMRTNEKRHLSKLQVDSNSTTSFSHSENAGKSSNKLFALIIFHYFDYSFLCFTPLWCLRVVYYFNWAAIRRKKCCFVYLTRLLSNGINGQANICCTHFNHLLVFQYCRLMVSSFYGFKYGLGFHEPFDASHLLYLDLWAVKISTQ